ncbi:MAG: hypothetical protein NDJ90_07525 [Oligoflexia bacterium]|nr:hypothetical protein [Oligoflexia bacterium]
MIPGTGFPAGGDHSGGGGDLKADFRVKSGALVERLSRSKDPLALDFARRFRRVLGNSTFKIDVVETLMDPETGKPVRNQRPLYAYGAPNWIQLKAKSKTDPGSASWEEKVHGGKNLDADVFHELAWAVGTDQDRDYQLSIGALKLHLSAGIQRERHKLLKTDTYYYHRGSSTETSGVCIYHFEVDRENRTFVMTGYAPGRNAELDDCSEVHNFEYNEDKDAWISRDLLAIEILPDGNFVSRFDDASAGLAGEPMKYFALGGSEAYRLEGSSGTIQGLCVRDALIAELDRRATGNGEESCNRLFAECKLISLYTDHRSGGSSPSDISCARHAVFEGRRPRL